MAIDDQTMERHPEKRTKPNLPPQQSPYLLHEIITEILSRLPVKSLLQFRSVSKSWRFLIDNPKFVKTHLKISSKNDEISHHRLVFSSLRDRCPLTIEKCHISAVLNGFSVNPTELDYPMKHPYGSFRIVDPYRSFRIVGSINGLICCLSMNEHIFFWNPTTRISKKLPSSGVKMQHICSLICGFGYNESTDDYRLVGIFRTIGSERLEIVMVYSLRTDCWRRIDNFPGEPLLQSGRSVNGAIHWVAQSTQNKGSNLPLSRSIVSLDLAKETYGEVAQPSYGEGEFDLTLDVLRECLFVLCDYRLSHADVWMMKEYGARESWTKLARISYANDPSTFVFPVLLHISKKGQILLHMGSRIMVYDPKNNSLRNPDIHNLRVCLEANTYIESLVSPLIQEGHGRHQ